MTTKTTTKTRKSIRKDSSLFVYSEFKSVRQMLKKYKLNHWVYKGYINKLQFPRLVLPCNEEGMKFWNNLVDVLPKKKYDRPIRTKSGGIKQLPRSGWFIEGSKNEKTLIYMDFLGDDLIGFRISFGCSAKINDLGITGRGAYFTMKSEFKKDNIDLDDYAIENGKEIKEEIKKPMIQLGTFAEKDTIYTNVSHIDLHSAYPSGIVAKYPELRPTIERIYNNRKKSEKDQKLKLTMDAAIGYFQSEYCAINHNRYALANLAKAGVNWCYDTINELANELRNQGKMILAFNTDGIWYVDDQNDFRSEMIGDGLGKAAIDHANCKIRFKSKGCYEYVENDQYHPVLRGQTALDRIKSRDQWKWGDIYQENAKIQCYRLDEQTHKLEKGEF